MLIGSERGPRVGADRNRVSRRQGGERLGAPLVGTDIERHAVAELPGISDLVGAVGAGVADVLVLVERPEGVSSRRARHVGVRLRVTEGEARPLDEGAGRADCHRALVPVLDMHRYEGAQGAVARLRAAVEIEVRTMPRRIRIDRAILRAVCAGVVLLSAAGAVPAVVGLHIAADLETDLTAWNVEEALAVQRADLHVLDRLSLDRKISSLRSRYSDKPCCGAKKKTLRYSHVPSSKVTRIGGSVSARRGYHPKMERPPKVWSGPVAGSLSRR